MNNESQSTSQLTPNLSAHERAGIEAAFSFIDRAISQTDKARPVTCRAGCSHCCREPLYSTKSEARYLLETIPHDSIAPLKQRVAKWKEIFVRKGLSQTRPDADKTDFRDLLKYRAAMIWCPLLDDRGLCMVYDARPLNCRTHLAIGSAKLCESDSKRPTQSFKTFAHAEVYGKAVFVMANGSPSHLYECDHLGVWLVELLLGEVIRTAASNSYLVTYTEP